MEITLKDEQINTAVQGAILAMLTPENRTELVAHAIKSLMDRPVNTGPYGEKRSVLQQVFDTAAQRYADKYIADMLTTDESFQTQMRQLLDEVSTRFFSPLTRPKLIEKMTDALSKAFTSDRY